MSSTFEDLVREISIERGLFPDDVRFVLSRAYRTLENVTPALASTAVRGQMTNGTPLWVFFADQGKTAEDLLGPIQTALRASPLAPPKDGAP
jgi:hypothetical protein